MKLKIAAVLLASLSMAGSVLAQGYTAQQIYVDGKGATLTGLNNLGQVIGYGGTTGNVRGFVSAPNAGELSFITPAEGSGLSGVMFPRAINDNGVIAGLGTVSAQYLYTSPSYYGTTGTTTVSSTTTYWAFVAGSDLSARPVAGLPAIASSQGLVPRHYVNDMNNRGDILIESYPVSLYSGPASYLLASSSPEGSYSTQNLSQYVPYSSFSSITGINDSGQISTFNYPSKGVVIEPGLTTAQNAPNLMGVQWAGLHDINASGQTIGSFRVNNTHGPRVFFAESGFASWKELLNGFSPDYALSLYGMNDSGQVIGAAYTVPNGSQTHAFMTGPQGEGFIDLNTLVSLSPGEYLKTAYAINNLGQILTTSSLDITYLLTPSAIPEPSTFGLMALGLLSMGMVKRKPKAV